MGLAPAYRRQGSKTDFPSTQDLRSILFCHVLRSSGIVPFLFSDRKDIAAHCIRIREREFFRGDDLNAWDAGFLNYFTALTSSWLK